jgi:predicted DNA-binding transcriptional regulator YafY
MRRADRLFHILQLIRGRRLTTAVFLSKRLEVSVRTIYRDIAELQHQGVPVEGEAGVGYRLGSGFDLPPLMFTQEEAKALVASVRLAQQGLDPGLAREAEDALGKILSVLPTAARVAAESLAVYAPLLGVDGENQQRLQYLREAVQARHKVRLHYRDPQDNTSERTIWPLGCFFWGKVWTLGAWCEARQDFRSFRVDRIEKLQVLDSGFQHESGKTLADFLRHVGAPAP